MCKNQTERLYNGNYCENCWRNNSNDALRGYEDNYLKSTDKQTGTIQTEPADEKNIKIKCFNCQEQNSNDEFRFFCSEECRNELKKHETELLAVEWKSYTTWRPDYLNDRLEEVDLYRCAKCGSG